MSILCVCPNIHFIEGEPCLRLCVLCVWSDREMSAKNNKRNGRNEQTKNERKLSHAHSLEGDIGTISWDLLYCECTHSVFLAVFLFFLFSFCAFARSKELCLYYDVSHNWNLFVGSIHHFYTHPMCHTEFDTVWLTEQSWLDFRSELIHV